MNIKLKKLRDVRLPILHNNVIDVFPASQIIRNVMPYQVAGVQTGISLTPPEGYILRLSQPEHMGFYGVYIANVSECIYSWNNENNELIVFINNDTSNGYKIDDASPICSLILEKLEPIDGFDIVT